jgi:hypothetical protein
MNPIPNARATVANLSQNILVLVALAMMPMATARADDGQARYALAMNNLHEAQGEYNRWVALDAAAKESLNQGLDADAKEFADELGSLAPKYVKDWNYGNAIQDFNLVLGRLALKAGDVESAKQHLLAAGHSPGSPQMDSFGPNMSLAKDLLAKGEKAVVLEYFDLCKVFWKLARGKLGQWKDDIAQDRIPDFGANLVY